MPADWLARPVLWCANLYAGIVTFRTNCTIVDDMNQRSINIVLVGLAVVATIQAQDKTSITERFGDLGKASSVYGARSIASPSASSATSSRVLLEKNVTIEVGSYKDYGQVPVDFGGAQDVAISLLGTGSDLSGVTILVAWAASDEFFTVTDFIKGNTFNSKSSGGGRVPVYGPGLRILVANDGQSAVTIKQLAVYALFR